MYLSHQHGFAFIAIPRTASRSLSRVFQKQYGAKPYGEHHDVKVPPGGWDKWQVIGVCRNPYSWMVSKYRSLPARWRQEHPEAVVTFERFVDEGLRRREADENPEGPYRSQVDWLFRGQEFDPVVIKYESLPDGLQALPFVRKTPRLPEIGRTGSHRDAYTDSVRRKVAALCRRDFEYFGYEP